MKQFRLITAAIGLFALAACTENDKSNGNPDGRTALQVSTASITTRATDNAWEAGDAIGITLFDAGTKNPVDGKTACKYITATAAGAFAPADKENTAYFPTQGKEADVIAFYPYTALAADLLIPVNTTDQQNLAAIDLMTAELTTGHSATKPDVTLTFKHRLTKLAISVDKEASAADVDLTGATVTLCGTATTAKWSLAEGKLNNEGIATDIAVPAIATKDALTATAIVLPTVANKGVKLVIATAVGKKYDALLASNLALSAGTVNTLKVHLRKTEATLSMSIADWTSGHTIDLQTVRIEGAGSASTPTGTLTPAQGDQLTLECGNLSSTYTANADKQWASSAPLYWDSFEATDAPFTFHALVIPDADGAPEKDYLVGKVTGIAFGAPIDFTTDATRLTHAMSQVSITLVKGTGFETIDLANAIVSLPDYCPLKSITTDGTLTLGTAAPLVLTANTSDGSYNARIAPQAFAAGSRVVTITIDGKPYSYNAPTGGLAFEANKLNKLTLTLAKTEVKATFSVADWTPGFNVNGNFELD